ncbi:MAG: FkbM family methyltransferase [Nanoarchaeota archaeon]
MKLKQGLQMIKIVKNYPLYFRDYFRIISNGYITYNLRNGLKFRVRAKTTDREALNEIWVYNIYLKNGFDINKDDLIIDIGGHVGLFSILASKKAPNGKVYVFEPDPENYELLNFNISANKADNIIPIKKAVSFKNESRDLFLSEENQEAHSFFNKSKNPQKITVETIALKDFMSKSRISKVDFLKIDCEGAEYEILYNCPQDILKKISKISMEYHNLNSILEKRGLSKNAPEKYNGEDLKSFLEKSGFNVLLNPYSKRRGMIYASRI